ncbi:alkaline phosphatase family protein [Planctomycetota bacterium]
MTSRVFVLGLDGATLDIVVRLAAQGTLPNFGKLIAESTYGDLASTIHPLTPQAWTSFLTGVNPGKHGIFGFSRRKPDGYSTELVTAADRQSPPIWELLDEHAGLTSGVVNVPLTWPPSRLNGFVVTGMHSPSLERATYPPRLAEEIIQQVPDYVVDLMSYDFKDMERFVSSVHAMIAARWKAVRYLYDRYRPAFFCCVFVGSDRIQHAFWQDGGTGEDHISSEIVGIYREYDRILGELLSLLSEDTTLLVMSDHGFGPLKGDVYLNQFLLDRGFLQLRRRARPPTPQRSLDPSQGADVVDWGKTKAYAIGLFGNIFVNVRGREPEGIVAAGRRYERLRDSLVAELLAWTHPEDGTPVVTRVFRGEELYCGPFVSQGPDLVVILRDYAYITRGGNEYSFGQLFAEPRVNHTGNHRINGLLVARGPGIRRGGRIYGARLIDLAPTILHRLDVAAPEHLDGEILHELLEVSS